MHTVSDYTANVNASYRLTKADDGPRDGILVRNDDHNIALWGDDADAFEVALLASFPGYNALDATRLHPGDLAAIQRSGVRHIAWGRVILLHRSFAVIGDIIIDTPAAAGDVQ